MLDEHPGNKSCISWKCNLFKLKFFWLINQFEMLIPFRQVPNCADVGEWNQGELINIWAH